MILYFLRHASAGTHFPSPKKDEKRALDKEGIEQCGYIGRALAALGAQVDTIVSSPLKRPPRPPRLSATNSATKASCSSMPRCVPSATLADFPQVARKICQAGSHHGGRRTIPICSSVSGSIISDSGC